MYYHFAALKNQFFGFRSKYFQSVNAIKLTNSSEIPGLKPRLESTKNLRTRICPTSHNQLKS